MKNRIIDKYPFADVFLAYIIAVVISGMPSTLVAWLSGGDIMEATWAAGEMLLPAGSSQPMLLAAAAVAHLTIAAFWTGVLALSLPRKHTIAWSLVAGFAIAILDLKIIGSFFPGIAALAFWPQVADHLMFTGTIGVIFVWRGQRQSGRKCRTN